jgi:hypothetical protein
MQPESTLPIKWILRIQDRPGHEYPSRKYHEHFLGSVKVFKPEPDLKDGDCTVEMILESEDQGHQMLDYLEQQGAVAAQMMQNCESIMIPIVYEFSYSN